MLDFDAMLVQVGEFGLYQKMLFVFQAPFCIFVTFIAFGQLFMQLYPNVIWCQDHFNTGCLGQMTPEQRQNISFPFMDGASNTCFLNNINETFIKQIADWETNAIRNGQCAGGICIFNYSSLSTSGNNKPIPESIYGANNGNENYGVYYRTSTPASQPWTSHQPNSWNSGNNRPNPPTTNPNNYRTTTTTPTQSSFVSRPNCANLRNTTRIEMQGINLALMRPVSDCRNIIWDNISTGVFYETIVTEGMWWCNAELQVTISQAIFFVGAIFGGFLIGWIADTLPALVIANLIGAIGGALSVVTTNFYAFSFFRFITGMAFDNCFVMMYILVLEFCGPSYRTIVANLSIAIFYTIGTLILPWLAVWVNNWRIFGLAVSLPMLLGLVALFVVPESARWLLSKGRATEATNTLRSFAKRNGRQVDEKIFVEFEEGAKLLYEEMANEVEPSLTEAFKTPRLRKTFILLVLIWSMIALVYDGHNRNILNLANAEWNVFWMFTIASMTELPADLLLIVTLDRFGRRWLAFASLCLSGICSLVAATIPTDERTVGLIMAMVSRFWVNVSFNIGLQYASELLPTVIRAQGVNIIHIMGYVASIISPLIAQIGRTQPRLSLIILGAAAIFGGVLSLFLAETLGEELPNSLEEAEAFGKNQSFWNCPICAKPKPEEEMPMEPKPETSAVQLRNSLRASYRGETYRSSIISNPSRHRFNADITLNPVPTETSKLRRVYTR